MWIDGVDVEEHGRDILIFIDGENVNILTVDTACEMVRG